MNTVESILGYKPSKEQMREFIKIAKEEKIKIGEVASRYSMPQIYIDVDQSGYIETPEEGRIPIEEFKKLHPWNKIVVIHGPEKE